jgi:hypothetical protein
MERGWFPRALPPAGGLRAAMFRFTAKMQGLNFINKMRSVLYGKAFRKILVSSSARLHGHYPPRAAFFIWFNFG